MTLIGCTRSRNCSPHLHTFPPATAIHLMLLEVDPLTALVFLHLSHSFSATGYGLARMFDNAFKRATELAAMFEANPFAAGQVFAREVQFVTSLPILQASPEHRSFILAMSAWVGAIQACRCGYWEVVEPLVQGACRMAAESRGLWRLSQSFMMSLLQVVPALKEPTAERVAAVSSGISLTKELHGDEETHWQTLLGECAAGNAPAYLYSPSEQQCDSPCCSRAPSLAATMPLILPAQIARCADFISHSISHLQKIEYQRLL
jgi:hypothetical protein